MKKFYAGNNLVEYLVIFIFVGFVIGYSLWSINPSIFRNFFMGSFSNNQYTSSSGNLTIGPMGN